MLNKKRVKQIYLKSRKSDFLKNLRKPQFNLGDLVNETISGVRAVDLQAGRKTHFYPGRYLDIIDFKSGRTLIIGEEGFHDYSVRHSYLVEKSGKVKYNDSLFSPDLKRIN